MASFWTQMQKMKSVSPFRFIISATRSCDYTPGDTPTSFNALQQINDHLLLQPDEALAHLKLVGEWLQGPSGPWQGVKPLPTSDDSVLQTIANYCCGQLGPMMKLCYVCSSGDVIKSAEEALGLLH